MQASIFLLLCTLTLKVIFGRPNDGSRCQGTFCQGPKEGAQCEPTYQGDHSCCPVWHCTDPNGVVSSHHGESGGGWSETFSSSSHTGPVDMPMQFIPPQIPQMPMPTFPTGQLFPGGFQMNLPGMPGFGNIFG